MTTKAAVVDAPVVAPVEAPVTTPVAKHTNPFPGREADEVEEFDGTKEDRGDVPAEASALETELAAKAAEDQAAADKVEADKIAADAKIAEEAKAAADKIKPEEKEADKEADKDHRIPKSRFDEINTKRKAAEAETTRLQAKLNALENPPKKPDAFDFDAKEEAYMAAVLDGDTKGAKAIRGEIRAAERAEYTATTETLATAKATETLQLSTLQQKTEAVVLELQGRFEIFDDSSDKYSEERVNETLAIQRGFIEQGMAPDAALRKAANYVTAGEVDRTAAAAPAPAVPAAPVLTPKKSDIKAKVAAANAQPPVIKAGESGASKDGSTDIANMDEAEFDALPESRKRALRGD